MPRCCCCCCCPTGAGWAGRCQRALRQAGWRHQRQGAAQRAVHDPAIGAPVVPAVGRRARGSAALKQPLKSTLVKQQPAVDKGCYYTGSRRNDASVSRSRDLLQAPLT